MGGWGRGVGQGERERVSVCVCVDKYKDLFKRIPIGSLKPHATLAMKCQTCFPKSKETF